MSDLVGNPEDRFLASRLILQQLELNFKLFNANGLLMPSYHDAINVIPLNGD